MAKDRAGRRKEMTEYLRKDKMLFLKSPFQVEEKNKETESKSEENRRKHEISGVPFFFLSRLFSRLILSLFLQLRYGARRSRSLSGTVFGVGLESTSTSLAERSFPVHPAGPLTETLARTCKGKCGVPS
jgi:hypothetical protein